jgi:hypothetical protein
LFTSLGSFASKSAPSLTSLYNQYQQGQQLSNQYGAGNVYGFGGGGQVNMPAPGTPIYEY